MSDLAKIGVLGGSGVYNLGNVEIIKEHKVETPFGNPSSEIIEANIDGIKCLFLPRHGKDHTLLPSEVNYRANIYALKKLGVRYLISVSAVGSLKEEYPPTTLVLPDQFIDWTKGGRERTFFGNGIVGHVSTALPIESKLQDMVANSCESLDLKFFKGGSYICIEGPQFSSKAESAIYRSFGADIIGMTNVPEAYLAKEAGMAFATIGMVTDYDCWKEEHCSLEEILGYMKKNNESAKKLLVHLIPKLGRNLPDYRPENGYSVMTPMDKLSADQKEIVDVLLKE